MDNINILIDDQACVETLRAYIPTIIGDIELTSPITIIDANTNLDTLPKSEGGNFIYIGINPPDYNDIMLNVLTSPFHISALKPLLLKIKNASNKTKNNSINIGDNTLLDLNRKELIHNKQTTALTEKEIALLNAIYHAGDTGVGREELLKSIWGYDDSINTHTLETHLYRLKNKVADLNKNIDIITTNKLYKLHIHTNI